MLGTSTPGEGLAASLALDPTPAWGLEGRTRGALCSVAAQTEGQWGRPGCSSDLMRVCTTVPMAFGFVKRRERPTRMGPELSMVVSTGRARGRDGKPAATPHAAAAQRGPSQSSQPPKSQVGLRQGTATVRTVTLRRVCGHLTLRRGAAATLRAALRTGPVAWS